MFGLLLQSEALQILVNWGNENSPPIMRTSGNRPCERCFGCWHSFLSHLGGGNPVVTAIQATIRFDLRLSYSNFGRMYSAHLTMPAFSGSANSLRLTRYTMSTASKCVGFETAPMRLKSKSYWSACSRGGGLVDCNTKTTAVSRAGRQPFSEMLLHPTNVGKSGHEDVAVSRM